MPTTGHVMVSDGNVVRAPGGKLGAVGSAPHGAEIELFSARLDARPGPTDRTPWDKPNIPQGFPNRKPSFSKRRCVILVTLSLAHGA
jgi:hypothetical protein